MTGRIVLLVTSPRLPAGLMTAEAWDIVRSLPVLAGEESEQTDALRAAGVPVRIVAPAADEVLGAADPDVVWLAGPAGDQRLARELGMRLAREPGLAELELMYGSWDPQGAKVLDAVAVMDRLLSPGGDPWKRAQTHASLAPYLLEEAYEAYDAIVAGEPAHIREEMGDVLLQVILHARLGEDADEPFTIDDVAADLVEKLIRRNPHVFADTAVHSLDEITENWERIKKAEKERGSAMDGIALAQPALSLAAKVLGRAGRAGVEVPLPSGDLGAELLAFVARARAEGLDAEGALRQAALDYADAVRRAEGPPDDHGGSVSS
ncbi:MazG family protein [Planosporangium mesophilum]|uniref:Nucleoside triphosphate pyrophosphohydrolase n=1 Tax=Planosporangium mesophilum TaxID=689768 RepID=A0A8J3TBM0_9ACTN|nr:MazG family protein [Planosporangium mesophilum]NJC84834.1 MazG family protein [Planosporangium mesophilum]GII24145.1 nucleoside triphosphate pyrophosphohydrolase [Planosporangium mesophilum]